MSGPRRRLSVAQVGGEPQGPGRFDEGATISELDQRHVLDILAQSAQRGGNGSSSPSSPARNRRGSAVGAVLEDVNVASFAPKQVGQSGDQLDLQRAGIGVTCRKGMKPESPNQDSWFHIQLEGDVSLFGVLDGHGEEGHEVSNFIKETLPKLVVQDPRFANDRSELHAVCRDAFVRTQELIVAADSMRKFTARSSGSTATLVVHDHRTNALTVAHVGDCTAALIRRKDAEGRELVGTSLTRDHKPNLSDERARIERMGGRVVFDGYANHRVYVRNGNYPGLNMSRAMGDLTGHNEAGICAEPEVIVQPLTPEDLFILVCSDGVWEFITPQDAANMVARFPAGAQQQAAEALAKEAWDRWIQEEGGQVVDDITVMLIRFRPTTKRSEVTPISMDFAEGLEGEADGGVSVFCNPWSCCAPT